MEHVSSGSSRRRVGIALVVLGLLTIVTSVIVVLEIANGPGTGPKAFAERRGYDQVKTDVHRSFPLALVAGLGGLALAMAGARLARREEARA
jgi:ABC-type Fe3+ transport system permease subunit